MIDRARRVLGLLVAAGALAWTPSAAFAHPDACSKEAIEDHGTTEYCLSDEETSQFDDSGANLGVGETGRTRNMHLLANLPKSGPFAGTPNFNSDIAFWGDYAIQGNYNGFQITNISEPESPQIVAQEFCQGSQNDVSVWGNLIFTSTDSRRTDDSCNSRALSTSTTPRSDDPNAEYWEGIKIFDWSNPASPELIKTIETDCGSHTHTLVPDGDRVHLYVSSYDVNRFAKDCRDTSQISPATAKFDHDKISVVTVPLADPTAATVKEVPLFPPGEAGYTGAPRETRGCHDITVYQAIGLAAGACMGEGIIFDISDPANPKRIVSIYDTENFAFWHSASFTNDGSKVIFTDELGGGGQAVCNPTIGDKRGANAAYDISDPAAPTFLSYYKIPRTQKNTENCVAHNGNFLPTNKRDVFVQAWYQGGTSVVDYSNPAAPKEIGFFDRGPLSETELILGGAWSSYFYNGFIYVNDIQKGLDVIKFSDSAASGIRGKIPYLNVQTQEPIR